MELRYKRQVERFGLKVKQLRKSRALTQQELAYKCEVDIRTIQRIEKGDSGVGLYILFAIADAFELSIPQLMSGI